MVKIMKDTTPGVHWRYSYMNVLQSDRVWMNSGNKGIWYLKGGGSAMSVQWPVTTGAIEVKIGATFHQVSMQLFI